jgi:hypothetical protein
MFLEKLSFSFISKWKYFLIFSVSFDSDLNRVETDHAVVLPSLRVILRFPPVLNGVSGVRLQTDTAFGGYKVGTYLPYSLIMRQ